MAKQRRFKTLAPNIPVLPPEYEAKGLKLNGEKLPALAEEMLWSCAHYYNHEIYWPKLLRAGNFWKCLKPELTESQQKLSFPRDFEKLLSEMQAMQAAEKEQKAAYRKEHKREIEAEKAAMREAHGFALVDGEKYTVPYLVEAPSIIITRGEDPRFGCWKYRVKEEDITLNCVGTKAPAGWSGQTESSPTSQWVFKYKMRCGRPEMKTFMEISKKVSLGGAIAEKNTEKKFDKTLDVIKSIGSIEKQLLEKMKSKDLATKQAAACAYLVMLTGIRIGNERDLSKFADTVGASTLRVSNIRLS